MAKVNFLSKSIVSGLLVTTAMVAAPQISAQEANTSVKQRPNPDYDALGVRSGSFLLMPSAEAGVKSDSNIYATRENKFDDLIFSVKPGFMMASDWNSHAFNLFANADFGYFEDNSDEDYTDYSMGADGRVDISTGTFITMAGGLSEMHEDRGSPDSPGAQAEATKYKLLNGNVGFVRDLSALSLKFDAGIEKFDYSDSDIVGGGIFNNDDRDRDVLNASTRVGYEIGENTEAYVRYSLNKVAYDDSTEDGGPLRDSDGYEAIVGAVLDVTGKTTFDGFVGFVKQSYDANLVFDAISEFTYGINMLWNPTQLTSVLVNVGRSVQETTALDDNGQGIFVPSNGILNSSYSVRIEHELRRNIILEGGLSLADMEFVSTARDDKMKTLDFGMTYKLNRNMRVSGSYKFDNKTTNLAANRGEYKRHALMANFKYQW